ncbi:MAG: carboxymuconolactone decarboxylase family protein [Dehalococcoidia bacterium]
MTSEPATFSPEIVATLAQHAPGPLAAMRQQYAAVWSDLDPRLAELCRQRVAMLQADAPANTATEAQGVDAATLAALARWPDSPLFTEAEKACLAYTEMFVADVAGITEADTQPVLDALGGGGLYALTNALLVLDQQQRIALSLGRLFRTGGTP